jgi:hypothetical protein
MRFDQLTVLPNPALEEIFRAAAAPSPQTLVGFEWRGFNIGSHTRLLGIQKFIKGFFSLDDAVEGYNVRVHQNGLSEAWIHLPNAENPTRYAFFVVTRVDTSTRDSLYPQALFINYGASPRNPRMAVERSLRDYLCQPDPDNPNLLIGKAYLAFASLRIFSNYFIIERLRPTDWLP